MHDVLQTERPFGPFPCGAAHGAATFRVLGQGFHGVGEMVPVATGNDEPVDAVTDDFPATGGRRVVMIGRPQAAASNIALATPSR